MRSAIQFALILLFPVGVLMAQNADKVETTDNRQVSLPEIGVNFGVVHLMSDVALTNPGPNLFTQFGYQLTVTQRIARYLNLSLNLFTGTVYGEEMRNLANLNYRTALFSQQLNVEYNFYPLLKPDERGRQLLRPYIGFGAGAMLFRSKGDLRDANGDTYNYWSDGTIRNLAENSPNAEAAILLERDMVYESDLRDANLDGLRKYPQATFTLPFHAGIRIQVSKNLGVNAAFTYAMNFSDMLDNSGAQSLGDRASSSGYDHHIFCSVGVNVFFGKVRPKAQTASEPQQLAQSVNRWKKKETGGGKEDIADGAEKSSSKKANATPAEVNEDEGFSDVIGVQSQVAYKADGTTIELATKEMTGADGTPIEQLFDAQGRALTPSTAQNGILAYRKDGTPVPLILKEAKGLDGTPHTELFDANGHALTGGTPLPVHSAFRADGSQVAVVATDFEGADGTRVEQLLDSQGKNLNRETAAATLIAFRFDGTVVEVVPKGFVGVDGTPIDQLVDADGRRLDVVEVPRRLAYTAEGRPVEISFGPVAAKDGTPAEKLFDANGNAFADAPVASARLAYRAEGTAVELASKEMRGADGTPANQLFDAKGQLISVQAPVHERVAYRADGSAVQLVTKNFEAADGTPITQLLDAHGQPMTKEAATTSLLAYRKDGSAVELIPTRLEAVDGTSSAQLFDANGNAMTSETDERKLAYKEDGSVVQVSYTDMAGADGTPLHQLVDAKGVALTVVTASPSRLAYRADGTPIEVVAKGVTVADETPKVPLFDAHGRPLKLNETAKSVDISGAVKAESVESAVKTESDAKQGREKGERPTTPSDKLTLAELEKAPPKLSGKFHWADRDSNGYISADEVLFCIDQLFDGDGILTVETIQELIDFYFDQD